MQLYVVLRPIPGLQDDRCSIGNKGDEHGEAESDPLTIGAAEMWRIADAWARGFGVAAAVHARAITLNRPYKGGFEIGHYGATLAARKSPQVGAVQVEFLRETLLGPRATAQLHQPMIAGPGRCFGGSQFTIFKAIQ